MADKRKRIEILNRKAGFNFHIDQTLEVGMVLLGTEVKSIRNNNVNMGDAYCLVEDGELFIKNLHISEYKEAAYGVHNPMRIRKLLAKKIELRKLENKVKTKGVTLFPIRLFETERGLFKLEMGVGTGKKQFDKREDIKAKDVARELQRIKRG